MNASVQKRVQSRIEKLTAGGSNLVQAIKSSQTIDTLTKWGPFNIEEHISRLTLNIPTLIQSIQEETIRREISDIIPLLNTVSQTPDPEFQKDVLSKSTDILLQNNTTDIQETISLRQVRLLQGEKDVPDSEKMISEKLRKRILLLVHRAPNEEFSAKQPQPVYRNMNSNPIHSNYQMNSTGYHGGVSQMPQYQMSLQNQHYPIGMGGNTMNPMHMNPNHTPNMYQNQQRMNGNQFNPMKNQPPQHMQMNQQQQINQMNQQQQMSPHQMNQQHMNHPQMNHPQLNQQQMNHSQINQQQMNPLPNLTPQQQQQFMLHQGGFPQGFNPQYNFNAQQTPSQSLRKQGK